MGTAAARAAARPWWPAPAAGGATSDFTTGGVGRVAIIAAAGQVEAVRRAAGAGDADDVDAPLVTLTPRQAKGLEFDAVVLVEPGAVAAGPGGVADLYVAMTRPTRRLIVIHAEPLPAGLDGPRTKTRL